MSVRDAAKRGSGARRVIFLWLLAALSPLWLGPSLTPLLVAVAEAHHVCACGMAVGTCGCPACMHLERERLSDKGPHPFPMLKGECDRGPVVLVGVAVPPAVLPPALVGAFPESTVLAPTTLLAELASIAASPPPTPPPRTLLPIA